ncbi:MAG: putative selenate ABC transporter substrate-binding protein [Acidimicrobiales bacterium]|nr:MAG: putative selenate ABC transporter substrate-binding protein [Acidimicrobiales bacterium]
MNTTRRHASWRALIATAALLAVIATACGDDGDEPTSSDGTGSAAEFEGTLRIGAIPDQDPERLQRTYGGVAEHLAEYLPGATVEYVPVTDYEGAVTGFRVGDLDAVWFGGLTGVQARLEVEGAQALVQRDIDEAFTSVFIAAAATGLDTMSDVSDLAALEGHSFTFGSESSTSGRLMPQSFLTEAGLDIDSSFAGLPGFSGSHDATIEVVSAGTYEVGALNSQVWDDRVAEGVVDETAVVEIFRTPPYYDYHWVVRPDLDERLGDGATDAFVDAMLALDASDEADAEILDLFGAESFIRTENDNYAAIEAVARAVGLIR